MSVLRSFLAALAIAVGAIYLTLHGTQPKFFHDLHDNTIYVIGWVMTVLGAVKLLTSEWPHDKDRRPPGT